MTAPALIFLLACLALYVLGSIAVVKGAER